MRGKPDERAIGDDQGESRGGGPYDMLVAMAATGVTSRVGRFPTLAKYEVKEEIGHGGMATVYRALDPRLSRDVAIKVIHPHLRDSLEAKARFHAEAKAVAMLRHPNIVEVYDVSSEDEADQYLVVELVRGVTLRKLLQDRGALPPEVAAALGVEMLAALAHAHTAGVVHRDIKPENVMLEHRAPNVAVTPSNDATPRPPVGNAPGDRVSVKLMDFGIAKLLDAQGVTSTGQVLGSPAHMAPEQIEGGDVDARADVFGLGVLLYEAMVGHLPFEGKNPAQVLRRVLEGIYPSAEHENAKIGKRWSAVLDRALARSPTDRYASATAMRDAMVTELAAMGIESSRAELEAWLDEPEGYGSAHDAAAIGKLCERGRVARGKGNVLDAAAHFNRALAYAPHDPALLKIVTSMHRSRAVRDFAMRTVPLVLVSVALGAGAFFAGKAIRHRLVTAPTATAVASAAPPLAGSSSAASPVSAPPIAVPAPAPTPIPNQNFPRIMVPAKVVERRITLDSLNPPFAVLVAVDGESIGEAHVGQTLVLDGKPHDLRFTCMEDECDPWTKSIAAGDEAQIPVAVTLNIKPAAIVVDGDPTLSYGLEEFPSVPIRVGFPASVPIKHGNYAVHVIERPSGRRQTGKLYPGKEAHVTFPAASP